MAKVPPFALFYGPMKIGKTSAIIKAFPNAQVIGERGAVEPLEEQWGIARLDRIDVATIHEAVLQLKTRLSEKDSRKKKKPLVIDDASLVMESTVVKFENSSDMRAVYGDMHKAIIKLRDIAQDLDVPVLMNCHEKPPETKDGRVIPGGPSLPGKAGAAIGAGVQTLARAGRVQRKVGWPVAFLYDPKNPQWLSGDRHGVLFDQAPMNPRAMYVSAGYELDRGAGLEWQDEVMWALAESLLAIDPKAKDFEKQERALLDETKAVLLESYRPAHVAWAIEDGRDLAAYVRRRDLNALQYL